MIPPAISSHHSIASMMNLLLLLVIDIYSSLFLFSSQSPCMRNKCFVDNTLSDMHVFGVQVLVVNCSAHTVFVELNPISAQKMKEYSLEKGGGGAL